MFKLSPLNVFLAAVILLIIYLFYSVTPEEYEKNSVKLVQPENKIEPAYIPKIQKTLIEETPTSVKENQDLDDEQKRIKIAHEKFEKENIVTFFSPFDFYDTPIEVPIFANHDIYSTKKNIIYKTLDCNVDLDCIKVSKIQEVGFEIARNGDDCVLKGIYVPEWYDDMPLDNVAHPHDIKSRYWSGKCTELANKPSWIDVPDWVFDGTKDEPLGITMDFVSPLEVQKEDNETEMTHY